MDDILIHSAYLVTMEGEGAGIIMDGAVAIKGNKITAVGKSDELRREHKAQREIDAKGKVVMPGLINAHSHTWEGAIRGVAQDTNNWMQRGVRPFTEHFTLEAMVTGSMVTAIEALKSGTTTLLDFNNPMDAIVKNFDVLGIRARVAPVVNEMMPGLSKLKLGELYPFDSSVGQERLLNNIKLFEAWNGARDGRITVLFGPQGPDMLSKELLLEVRAYAKKFGTKIHMHVAQGDREINQMLKRHGKRSIPYLDEIGYIDGDLLAVHLTEATREEVALLARKGAVMIACVCSIGIIDGIVVPIMDYLAEGGKVALGTDQTPGNNNCNMFNEMKFAAVLGKCKVKDPTALPAWKALRLATIESAEAVGLGAEVGSFRPGKKADVIIIDMTHPNLSPIITYPMRNIVPNLVYAGRGHEVETVIVDGKVIIDNYAVLTVNEKEAVAKMQAEADKVAAATVEDYKVANPELFAMTEKGFV